MNHPRSYRGHGGCAPKTKFVATVCPLYQWLSLNDDIMKISTLPPRHISLYDSAPPPWNLQLRGWHECIFFLKHNLKIYNLTKHIYINDTIESMIGMANLIGLYHKNNTDNKGYTKVLVPS